MRLFKTILMGFILTMLISFLIQAQIPDPVKFSVADAPEQVMAGEVFTITINTSIEGKWKLYSILNHPDAGPYPTKFSAKSTNFVLAGDVSESKAEVEYDPNFETELGL